MMTPEERTRIDELGGAIAKAIGQTWLANRDNSFEQFAEAYRRLESEFLTRTGDHPFYVLELKRRVAESIFTEAVSRQQSWDVCHAAWLALVELGLTNSYQRRTMSSIYADYCLRTHHLDEGIAILEPLIPEVAQWMAAAPSAELARSRREELDNLQMQLDDLRTEAARCADPLILELAKAIDTLSTEMADADIREYKVAIDQLEEAFVARAGDDEARIREIKWRTTYALFESLPDEVRFASCQACFDELIRLGFDDLARQCDATWLYGNHCLSHDQLEAGHAVVDPLLADLRKRLEDPNVTDEIARQCRLQLPRLQDVLEKREPYRGDGSEV